MFMGGLILWDGKLGSSIKKNPKCFDQFVYHINSKEFVIMTQMFCPRKSKKYYFKITKARELLNEKN